MNLEGREFYETQERVTQAPIYAFAKESGGKSYSNSLMSDNKVKFGNGFYCKMLCILVV